MDLKAEFSKVCNKKDAIRVAEYVFHNPNCLKDLIGLLTDNDKSYSHRAGWTLNTLNTIKDIDLSMYTEELVELFLSENVLNSSIRNLLHVFRNLRFDEDQEGMVLDKCFRLLEDIQTEAAIKCLAVETIYRIAKHEPLLLKELKTIMSFQLEYSSAAFGATYRKYTKLIDGR